MDVIGNVKNLVGQAKDALSDKVLTKANNEAAPDKVLAAVNKKEADKRNLQNTLDDIYKRIGERTYKLKGNIGSDAQIASLFNDADGISAEIDKISAEIRQLNDAYALASEMTREKEEPAETANSNVESAGAACRSCGAQIPEDSAFCIQCGAKAAEANIASIKTNNPSSAACRSCGAALPEGSAFCNNCGAKVSQSVTNAPEPQAAFCMQCGAKLPEGSAFCIQCGAKA